MDLILIARLYYYNYLVQVHASTLRGALFTDSVGSLNISVHISCFAMLILITDSIGPDYTVFKYLRQHKSNDVHQTTDLDPRYCLDGYR